MNSFFNAVWERFNKLPYSRKFLVITVIYILPIIAFIPLIRSQTDRLDQYGERELFGTLYLRPLWRLTDSLQQHQLVAQQYLSGNAEFSEVEAAQGVVDNEFERYEFVQSQEILSLELRDAEGEIKSQWLTLRASVENGDPSNIEVLHSNLYDRINLHVAHVGDFSNLILDPDLDTYYAMDSVLLKLPENQRLIFEIHQLMATRTGTEPLPMEDATRLTVLLDRMVTNLDSMNRNINVAWQYTSNADIRALAPSALDEYETSMMAFVEIIKQINNTAPADGLDERLALEYEKARRANLAFYDRASGGLQAGISARVNSLILQFYGIAIVAAISVVGAFLLGQSVIGSISQPLAQLATTAQRLADGDLTARVATETTDELGRVSKAFNQMAADLEKERTSLLSRTNELEMANELNEKRTRVLQSVSEISRTVASEQNLQALLPLVTQLVSEKLNFYHVGIFLFDEFQRYAVLHAANSEGGQRMLRQGHKLEFGTGIVGYVAATGSSRIALDTGSDAAYFNNPNLPETHSEMALPLRSPTGAIGVLDIQSKERDAFNTDDIQVLSALADQVAIAIQNSRYYETTQKYIAESQKLAGQFMQDSWRTLQTQKNVHGFIAVGSTLRPIDPIRDTVDTINDIQNKNYDVQNGEKPSLAVPIRMAGEVVGIVNVRLPEKRNWDEDEIDITRAVTDRLSLALESVILLDATQKRAEIERLTSTITGKISSTTQFDSILRTAAEELSRVLGGSEVLVQIQSAETPEPVK